MQAIVSTMRSVNEHSNELEGAYYRELRLLEEMEHSPEMSQRQLARNLGVALGVANLLVRNVAKKGYIKIKKAGWRRWVYIVTPRGVARRVYLTLGYIERFIDHYSRVRNLLRADIGALPLNGESRVAVLGTTELAELAYLALRDNGVEDIEIFGLRNSDTKFLGMQVQALDTIKPQNYAKVVLADSSDPEGLRCLLYSLGFSDSQVLELLYSRWRRMAGEVGSVEVQ